MLNIKEKKLSIIMHSLAGVFVLALLTICAFYDLQISKSLSNGNSFFGAFFAVVGEIPAYLMLPVCSTILLYGVSAFKNRALDIAFRVVAILACFGGLLLWFYKGQKLGERFMLLEFSLMYAFLGTLLIVYFAKFVNRDIMARLVKFAVFAIVVMGAVFAVTRLLKFCWGRVRFRDMLSVLSFDAYTPWYMPNAVGEGTSFPSGHTASAFNLFVIVVFADIFPRLANKKILLYVICFTFGVLTALSRVVFNAHFLSDTIVGGGISYGVFYIVKSIMFRKKQTGEIYD